MKTWNPHPLSAEAKDRMLAWTLSGWQKDGPGCWSKRKGPTHAA